MLNRLETTYLAILRVLILVVATLALLTALFAGGTALYGVIQARSGPGDATSSNLADYISERKTSSPAAANAHSNGNAISSRPVDSGIAAITANIVKYLGLKPSPEELASMKKGIETHTDGVISSQHNNYVMELKSLTEQLSKSKGQHLDANGVADLLEWHRNKFNARVNEMAADRAGTAARTAWAFYVAGYAFMFFIVVIFTFLFVKVERSLRLVHVVHEGDQHEG